MNGLQLIATGGALPGRTVTNEDLSRVVKLPRIFYLFFLNPSFSF